MKKLITTSVTVIFVNFLWLKMSIIFLLVCGAYTEMRKKLIPAFYWNPPSIFKFEQLMSRNDLLWLNKLSAFLKEAMNERSRLSILHQ